MYCICSVSLCYHKNPLGSSKALSLVRFLVDHIDQVCHPTKENQGHIFHLPARDPSNIIFSLSLLWDRKLTSHKLNEIRTERKIKLIFLILFYKPQQLQPSHRMKGFIDLHRVLLRTLWTEVADRIMRNDFQYILFQYDIYFVILTIISRNKM